MLHLLRLIFLFVFVFPVLSIAQDLIGNDVPYNSGNVSSIMEKAREDAKQISLPVNKYAEEGQKAAKQVADKFHSPEFQKQIQCEQQRLEKEVFRDYTNSWTKTQSIAEQSENSGSLADTEKVYLFFSSSVPDETVHAYFSDIARVEDPNLFPVMRGFVKGIDKRKTNAKYLSQILKKDLTCLDEKNPRKICQRLKISIRVNPPLFTMYGITKVPALVYANEQDAFIIRGDVGLDYLLERINLEAKSKSLDNLIRKIRGEY